MELRKEEEGPLQVRDLTLRSISKKGLPAQKRQKGREAGRSKGRALDALARLPPRQKKQWDLLPPGKKRRFLKAAQRREAASLPFFERMEGKKGVPGIPEEERQRFRIELEGMPQSRSSFKRARLPQLDGPYLQGKDGAALKKGTAFGSAAPSLAQTGRKIRTGREAAAMQRFRDKERKREFRPPRIRKSQINQALWPRGDPAKENQRRVSPIRKHPPKKGIWSGPRNAQRALYSRERNWKESDKKKRSKINPSKNVYRKNTGKTELQTLMRLLKQDARKEAGSREAKREEAISLEEQTQETQAAVLRGALLPARLKLELLKGRLSVQLLSDAKSAAWHLALAALALFLPLLLALFLVALLGGLAGEEERKEQYQAAYPVSGYEIAAYAKEWVGITKYVWGAGRNSETDWQDYADCSSFAHGVFSHFGIEIGSTTYAQENAGTLVEGGLSQAQPGDLILFYSGSVSPGNSSHVGIYLGEGQMVHCSGGSANTYGNPGRGVCIGSVQADGRPYAIRRIALSSYSGGEALLSVLASYNARLEADREGGSKWWYTNRGTALTWREANEKGPKATNCALLVRWALKDMGILERDDFFYYTYGNTFRWTGDTEAHLRQNLEILEVRETARTLIQNGNLQPGDICCWHSMQHVNVYAGENRWFDAGRGGTNGHGESFGHLDSGGWESTTYVFEQWGPVPTGYLDTQVDYILRLPAESPAGSGTSGGYRTDSTPYTQEEMELIWAVVAQEDNGSYAGALAVISSAMNRSESGNWSFLGSNALAQLTAPGQYCYSMDAYWKPRLNGNVPDYVKQAVYDCLKRGIRNHPYTSFRSTKGSQTGPDAVQIGGNWFFGS